MSPYGVTRVSQTTRHDTIATTHNIEQDVTLECKFRSTGGKLKKRVVKALKYKNNSAFTIIESSMFRITSSVNFYHSP